MSLLYISEDDIQAAVQEAHEKGRAVGRREASQLVEWAAGLNGYAGHVVKALQRRGGIDAALDDDTSPDPHDALTLSYIDALIESKTHDPESEGSEVASVLSHWFTDPEAFADALSESDGLDAEHVEKALRVIHKAWDEQKHPRDHGQFASAPGGSNEDTDDATSSPPPWHDLPSLQSTADSWAARILKSAIKIPGSVMASVRARVNAAYDKLSSRYGKGFARAAVAAGVVGLAIPLPGASIISAAPVIGLAELHRQLTQVKLEGEPTLIRKAANWLVARATGGTKELKDDPIREVLHKATSFDAAKHPRDDAGRFVSKEAIHEAKSDPAKAEELRARVTDPDQRAKLDAALGGTVDLGRTKAGEAKAEVERKRTERAERLQKVRSLANEISMARRGGEPVPASHFAELAKHLPHLSVQDLRSTRIKLAASFAGGRRREEMSDALVRHAKNEVERLNEEKRYDHIDPLDFGMDAMTGVGGFNARGPHGNPNSPEQHGGRMTQRHQLDVASTGKVDVGSLTHVKDRWPDGESAVPVAKNMDAASLSHAFTQSGRGKLVGAASMGPNGKVASWKVKSPDGGKDLVLSDDEVRQAVIDAGMARGSKTGETHFKAFDESKVKRGQPENAGEFAPKEGAKGGEEKPSGDSPPRKAKAAQKKPSEKAVRAIKHQVPTGKEVQRYAEEHNEPRFAKVLGGKSHSHPDSEPKDVTWADKIGKPLGLIEMKTLVTQKNDKITMDTYSQVRKVLDEQKENVPFHTVISDDREVFHAHGGFGESFPGEEGYSEKHDDAKRIYYYRRGIAGSARISTMHRCKDETELKKLMAMPDDQLPPAARRTDAKLFVGKWQAVTIGGRKAFTNKKTGQTVRAKE